MASHCNWLQVNRERQPVSLPQGPHAQLATHNGLTQAPVHVK